MSTRDERLHLQEPPMTCHERNSHEVGVYFVTAHVPFGPFRVTTGSAGTAVMRLELTRRTDYAVRAMLVLARNPGANAQQHRDRRDRRRSPPLRYPGHGRPGRGGLGQRRHRPYRRLPAYDGSGRQSACWRSSRPWKAMRAASIARCAAVHASDRAPCEIHHVFSGAQEAFIAELRATRRWRRRAWPSPTSSGASPRTPRPGAALEVELREDRADVVLDRLVGQEYLGRDLLVRLALGDEQQDLLLL